MPEEIQLSIRNIDLAALHWPGSTSCRILALHGWLDNAMSFAALAEKFPDYEIVALDFPGHGYSDHRPSGELLHYVDYIVDIYEVLKALQWEKCILMGHSMGAGVASVFASAFQEKLQGLICIDGLGPITSEVGQLPGRLKKSVRMNVKASAKSKTIYTTIDEAVEARYQAGDLSRVSVEKLVSRNLTKIEQGYIWRSDPRLRLPSLFYLSEEQARAYMEQVNVPTLMIRPSESGFRAQKILKERAALITNLTWVDVPGGHHTHMDHPDYLVPPITDFIKTLEMG